MTASPEWKKWLFQAAVLDAANHGTTEQLVALLRADHALTTEDKSLLAEFIAGKLRKRSMGRPKLMPFSRKWYAQKAADEVRKIQKDTNLKRSAALNFLMPWITIRNQQTSLKTPLRKEEILEILRRSSRPKPAAQKTRKK